MKAHNSQRKIEWNKVTWYSQLVAIVVFVMTFVFAFTLGVTWQKVSIERALSEAPMPVVGGTGAHCGGFIRNAPQCATGYHCQLAVSRPDTGGVCVAD